MKKRKVGKLPWISSSISEPFPNSYARPSTRMMMARPPTVFVERTKKEIWLDGNWKKYNCNLMQVENVLTQYKKGKEQRNYNKNELFFVRPMRGTNNQNIDWIHFFDHEWLLHSQIRMVSLLWIHRWPWHSVLLSPRPVRDPRPYLKMKLLLSVTHKTFPKQKSRLVVL